MKKHFILSVIIGLALLALPLMANAEIVDSGTCGDNMTWQMNDDGTLIISGNGKMISNPWNNYKDSIRQVVIDNGVTSIVDGAFALCDKLETVSIANTVTEIGDEAFHFSGRLESVVIPSSVESIGKSAFEGCSNLKSVNLTNGIKRIGIYAFDQCGIESFFFPASLQYIDEYIFLNCGYLEKIDVEESNPWFASVDGVLFSKDKHTLIKYPRGKKGTSYTIPESVNEIGGWAFCANENIVNVLFSDNITRIGDSAFSNCYNISNIELPRGLIYIDSHAFCYCTSLKNVILPSSVTNIGTMAFWECSGLTNMTILGDVDEIQQSAFQDCSNLVTVSLSDGIKSIGPQVFSGCVNLKTINIPQKLESIGWEAFYSCRLINSLTIPYGVSYIGEKAYEKCYSLNNIEVPICNQYAIRWFSDNGYKDKLEIKPHLAIVIDAAVAATYTEDGLTEGSHCSVCGEVLVAQQVIPKLEPQTPEEKIKAFVSRCYQVILGRGVDPEGLSNWSAALMNGTAQASQIIDGIVSSQEYALKNLNHEASVKVLYQAMLGRDPDPAGLAAWTKVLDDGYPFGSVIIGFCGSPEFIAICNGYGIQPGSVNVGPVIPKPDDDSPRGLIEGFVKRCYVILLDRGVDPTGLKDWSDALENGVAQASQIIDGIVNSQEFQLRGLTNEQKVDCLYMAMLGRGADPDGKAAWVQVLADGHPYAAVINGFCGSIEFGNICAEYRIQPGSVAVKGVLVKREAITPEGEEPEAPVVYQGYNSEFINEEKIRAFVEHCYVAVFGREGDTEGVENYTKLILNGRKMPKKVAYEFIFSSEFQEKLPGNEKFIRILYRLYLYREADAEGLAGWVQMLESGTSLEDIVNGFASSAEFKAIVNSMKE